MQIGNNPNKVYGSNPTTFQILNSTGVSFNVDNDPDYSGVGTGTAGVPIIGAGLRPDNDNCTFGSRRIIEGDALFAHAFRAFDLFKSDSAGAYTCFDARSTITTNVDASKYNHSYAFQWNMTFDATNGIDLFAGVLTKPIVNSGIVDRLHHIDISDAIITGGAVTEHVGIWINNLTGGASNYGIFQSGTNPNYFGGNCQLGGSLNSKDITANGTLTAFPNGGGIALTGITGAAALPAIQGYADSFGTPNILLIQPIGSKVLVGGTIPANGATLEVQGDIISDDYITGLSVIGTGDLHALSTISHFDNGGGVAVAGNATADGGAVVRAYSDNSGTGKNLYLNDNGGGVVVGANAQIVGGNFEVVGDANISNGHLTCNQKIMAEDGLGVGNSASAATLGALARKMEIFDETGISIGFIPIYATIT